MNIRKISSVESNNLKKSSDATAAKKTSLSLDKSDSVTFSGKTINTKKLGGIFKLASVRGAALLTVFNMLFSMTGCGKDNNMQVQNINEPQQITEETNYDTEIEADKTQEVQDNALTKIEQDNLYQLAQKTDHPSITFDFTDNYAPHIIEPEERLVEISREVAPDKYQSLSEILTNVYKLDENEIEARALAGKAIIKANPWMADSLSQEYGIDYSGDVTNIPNELIPDVDFSKYVADSKAILLPNTIVFVDNTTKDSKTVLYDNVVYVAKDADKETGVAEIKISKKEVENKTDDEIAEVINTKLADAYGIKTMNSYAGQAIYHTIGIWEPNEEIFEKTSEKDLRKALLNYVKENQGAIIKAPIAAASVMIDADQKDKYGSAKEMLEESRTNGVTTSYISVDYPVYDMTELPEGAEETEYRQTTLLEVLDACKMPDGQSIKQLFESNKGKYKSLALAAARQIIDNDDKLREQFGDKVLKIKNLNEVITYSKEEVEKGEARINLQPIAIAIPDKVKVVEAPKVRKATYSPKVTVPDSSTPVPTNTTPNPTNTTPNPTNTTPNPTNTTPNPTNTTPNPTNTTPNPTNTTPIPTNTTPIPTNTTPTPTNTTPVSTTAAPTVKPTPTHLPDTDDDPTITTVTPNYTTTVPTDPIDPGACPEVTANPGWGIMEEDVASSYNNGDKYRIYFNDPSLIANYKDIQNA